MKSSNVEYFAGSYQRLSKEDMDSAMNGKNESNSITNQKELIRNYVQSHPEINIVKEYTDDGFSGVNFERPAFLRMMEDLKQGVINCIIVKDLSRFGRNYIEAGKYLEEIFPVMGVRFISISESYDTICNRNSNEQLVIPFMNLVNDTYCRDISVKVRSSLEMKRQNGEFVGAFAAYGYQRSESDKHQLVIDEEAAAVVRRIYQLTMEGNSNGAIADLLNKEGVPCPVEYKRLHGEKYSSHFQTEAKAKWSPLTVRRILSNRIYIGVLEQGKTYSINYKVKGRLKREQSEWYCRENAHEAIIAKEEFHLIQKLLTLDFRTAPNQKAVYLFSGLVCCANCKEILIRRKKTVQGKEYVYYGCYDKNKKLRCKHISIREDFLKEAVLKTIQNHINIVVKMSDLIESIEQIPQRTTEVRDFDKQIRDRNKEIEKYQNLKLRLYEDYHENFISEKEYKSLASIYDSKEANTLACISELLVKKEQCINGNSANQLWIKMFAAHKNVETLDRKLLLTLVDKIIVHSGRKIEIRFCYQDEFQMVKSALEKKQGQRMENEEILYG